MERKEERLQALQDLLDEHPYLRIGGYGGALVNGHRDAPDGILHRIVISATDVA
jgi:hypothetical protein